MSVTLKIVAQACGVDLSTVSRALRGDPRVASDTVVRVRTAAERLGYRANLGARALQAGATRIGAAAVGTKSCCARTTQVGVAFAAGFASTCIWITVSTRARRVASVVVA